jgi:hypothetical protein
VVVEFIADDYLYHEPDQVVVFASVPYVFNEGFITFALDDFKQAF